MLRIFEIKLPLEHDERSFVKTIAHVLHVKNRDIHSWNIVHCSVDARKKNAIKLVYTVDVDVVDQNALIKKGLPRFVSIKPEETYKPVSPGTQKLKQRPVIIGFGPTGMFAGLMLSYAGFRPLILERGKPVDQRCMDVQNFWGKGILNPQSNAQFGEGGAGTFSDGKLNTLIHDQRCRLVLEEFVKAGAPISILTSHKPHVGTDQLQKIVVALRESIIRLGGEVRFQSQVTGISIKNNRVCGLEINGDEMLESQVTVLAIGHSARDTFTMLHKAGVCIIQKPFAIGVRIEHQQQVIDNAQYGAFAGHPRLGPAEYKLAYHAPSGRSAYTFCMCPGGQVIAASSEPESIVTNGMSNYARKQVNANAALLVNITPHDFATDHPLGGFEFQRKWEKMAYNLSLKTYHAPTQLLKDFLLSRPSKQIGSVVPTYKPGIHLTDLRGCLPEYVSNTICQAIPVFARQLSDFDYPDAVLTGVETRSSCPARIVRNDQFQSSFPGLYPAGEGAGYAGGIMSSAVDGIRVAEAIISSYSPDSL